jgi:mRNA interferase MazF
VQRGEVWWAELPRPAGSEPGFRRPVLVIQSDGFNASRISTVVVVAITSNLALGSAPGNVALTRRDSALPRKSVVNVSQILTLDRSRLAERVGALPRSSMDRVAEGLRLVLSL